MAVLRLAFSPDSDDIFMFWPLLEGKVPPDGITYEAERADTQALNERARRGDGDVVALSIASYPYVADRYLLLPHGGSVGRGYGPVLVAPEAREASTLRGARIGVPGLGTTAYLVLRALGLAEFEPVVLPISPYAAVFEALRRGEVEAALLIHEGRLRYESEGMHKVLDVGELWASATGGLPLPLGGNVIRKGLGESLIAEVSNKLRESVRWALDHREQMIDELLAVERRGEVGLTRALLDRYLAMYANEDTAGYPPDAREACDRLVREGAKIGLYPATARVEWAP